jgi:hypothetical protein
MVVLLRLPNEQIDAAVVYCETQTPDERRSDGDFLYLLERRPSIDPPLGFVTTILDLQAVRI